MKNLFWLFFGLLTISLFFSCKHESVATTFICDSSSFTYSSDIKPIMDAHCTSCHTEGATVSNGFIYLENWANLNDYVTNDPEGFMGDITHDPSFNPMPKGGAKMSDCEIAKIREWINAGAPNN